MYFAVYPTRAADGMLLLVSDTRPSLDRALAATVRLAVALALTPFTLAAQASPVTVLADRYVAGIYEFFPEQAAFSGLADAPADRLSDNSLAAVARWQRLEDSLAAARDAIAVPAVGSPECRVIHRRRRRDRAYPCRGGAGARPAVRHPRVPPGGAGGRDDPAADAGGEDRPLG